MADRRLQVFHAVAKHLSFTRAADALFMSQPAVTFQVKQLEEEHNTRLFERRHGAISLTPAGELLLSYAEKILLLSDEMETRLGEMSGEMRGQLFIGASMSTAESLMPPVLAEFNALHPLVRVRLSVANSETLENRVAGHQLELALIDAGNAVAGVVYEACAEEEMQVVCAPDYPLAGQKKLTPAAMPEYEYLSREPGSGTRRAIESYLQANKIAPDSLKMQMELGSPAALKALAATGLGFAIVGRAGLAREIKLQELIALPLKPALKRKIHMIYPQGRFRSRMASTFIEFAKRKLRESAA